MTRTAIRFLHARQILDSRGRPTVEVDVDLQGGAQGRASVPSGASTGTWEACELRDADPARYRGLGVLRAVGHVNGEIAGALQGADALDQSAIDARLRALDGTPQLARLGANGILGVSLAVCRAAAAACGQPLYRRIAALCGDVEPRLPLPMVNILSGGLHAGRSMDIQDFLAIPVRAATIAEAIHTVSKVRDAAAAVCRARGLPTLLADEGGLSPGLETSMLALEMMVDSIEAAGLEPGRDVAIAVDAAATSLHRGAGRYELAREGRTLDADGMVALMSGWVERFPVVSIEDALGEEDWPGWKRASEALGSRIQLVGDDLFVTHADRLRRGIREGIANAVLVKVNQNGTLSGTLDVIALARAHGYAPIVSARSGETEDPFIADLAVGTAAGQIKIGSLRTSNTVAKYNQLLRIEEECGAAYAGIGALAGRGLRGGERPARA